MYCGCYQYVYIVIEYYNLLSLMQTDSTEADPEWIRKIVDNQLVLTTGHYRIGRHNKNYHTSSFQTVRKLNFTTMMSAESE